MERRLQKYMADCGLCSRRAAEEIIVSGRVTVNGNTAQLGDKVSKGDLVEVDGTPLLEKKDHFTYIMLNKPRGYITTMEDEEGRRCVADLLEDLDARVVPVGRLDRNSEGLLLLTDDGDLIYRSTHPSHDVPKQYLVTLSGFAGGDVYERLRGVKALDGKPLKPFTVEVLKKQPDRSVVRFTVTEGRNHMIRRICEEAGAEVLRLKRVSMGGIRLADVKPGRWRHLTEPEVASLKKSTQI